MQKIAAPEMNIAARSGELVKTIVELLEAESAVAADARRAQRRADDAAIAAAAAPE
jgi:ATP-dependent RNA helicase DHX36